MEHEWSKPGKNGSKFSPAQFAALIIEENYLSEDFRRILGINFFNDVPWFNKEGFEDALYYSSLFFMMESTVEMPVEERIERIAAIYDVMTKAEEKSEYRFDVLIDTLTAKNGAKKKTGSQASVVKKPETKKAEPVKTAAPKTASKSKTVSKTTTKTAKPKTKATPVKKVAPKKTEAKKTNIKKTPTAKKAAPKKASTVKKTTTKATPKTASKTQSKAKVAPKAKAKTKAAPKKKK